MPAAPPELQSLLHADSASRDHAWSQFVERFSPILLHTAHSVAREHDRAMDAYADLLARLREDDHRRLRQFDENGGAQFTTWLVVIVRRLCIDFQRQRYGRAPAAESKAADHAARRRLEDLVAVEIGKVELAEGSPGPEATLRERDQQQALRTSLDQLSPAHRLLLTLRFEDDLPIAEIARVLHLPTRFHVHRTLNTVLSQLRRSLLARGVDQVEP